MRTITKLCLLIILSSVAVFGQKQDYKNEPGYIDFGDLTSFESGDKITEVTLDEHLLKMAAGFSKEDKELGDMIGGLKLIKVNAFEVNEKNEGQIINKIKNIDNDLTNKNWDRIVRSKSGKETANIYIKTGNNGRVVGLVVTNFQKGGEAAFVNIVGNIDMESISKLSGKFDLPSLNHIKGKKK